MKTLSITVIFAAIIATSYAVNNPITNDLLQSNSLRKSSACVSWRLNVEINNLRDWDLVPENCAKYVGKYMLGGQYDKDCKDAADAAYAYAKTLNLKGDGKDLWIFDVDDTTLSTLPYQVMPENAFGSKVFNETKYREWEMEGTATAVPAMTDLYQKLLELGFKIVLITGRSQNLKNVTEQNLKDMGFPTWEKLIVKQSSDSGLTKVVYKSNKRAELVAEGYRILGNMGDQWSDLLGNYTGARTFKLPNPMYYTP